LKIIIFETKSHMTLTLTSDDLESHIIVNVSSTLTNTTIWFCGSTVFDCGRMYVRTYVRTYVHTDVCMDGRAFLPGLLGHLSGDDLKTLKDDLKTRKASVIARAHQLSHQMLKFYQECDL